MDPDLPDWAFKTIPEQRAEAEFIAQNDVWRHMARLLLEERGPCILRPTMRAEYGEDGLAGVTWTEAHYIAEEDYMALVERARLAAAEDA